MTRILQKTSCVEPAKVDSAADVPPLISLQGLSVNYHLWQPCNMRCKFCFATFLDVKQSFLPKGHLPMEKALEVVRRVAEAGAVKITFAGGEPTLCPWLDQLILEAKRLGLVTTVVTNGSRLTEEWLRSLQGSLNWVAISADSTDSGINAALGRQAKGESAPDLSYYLRLGQLLHDHGIKVKVNTVVAAANKDADLSALIEGMRPTRWKVLQALPVRGQNEAHFGEFEVTEEQFDSFLLRHSHLACLTTIVPEPVDLIRGSYVMIDPGGRFFDDVTGSHRYSQPILEVGVAEAFKAVAFDHGAFLQRGGSYEY